MKNIKLVLFLCSLCFSLDMWAQSKGFYQDIDRNPVEVGEIFQLTITLENIDASAVSMGDVEPFKIVGGPSTSSSYTIINGKSSGSKSYQYILQATQKGNFTLSSATARLGSKILKSNTISIKVVEPNERKVPAIGDKKSFVQLELSSSTAYPGQMIEVDYVLYTRQNVERYDMASYDYPDGFFVEYVNDLREQPQRKQINGQEYLRAVLRRDRLYAQKVGSFDIGPLTVSLEIPVENGRSSFFFSETKKENLKVAKQTLKILPLPTPFPNTFCGGVGEFSMKASIKKPTVVTGEAISLLLEIEGIGDPKTIKAPEQNWPEFLETYPPSLIKEEIKTVGGKSLVKKTFEFIAVSSLDTTFRFVPEMTYFDPEQKKYISVKGDSLIVSVVKGEPKAIVNDNNNELSPEISHLQPLKSLNSFWTPLIYLSLVGFILLSMFLAMWIKKKKLDNEALSKERKNSAQYKAHKSLEKAYEYMQNHKSEKFYDELASATTGFIIKAFDIPHLEANPQKISEHLSNKNISIEAIDLYNSIHQKAELARFAGVLSDMSSLYSDAEKLLNMLELK